MHLEAFINRKTQCGLKKKCAHTISHVSSDRLRIVLAVTALRLHALILRFFFGDSPCSIPARVLLLRHLLASGLGKNELYLFLPPVLCLYIVHSFLGPQHPTWTGQSLSFSIPGAPTRESALILMRPEPSPSPLSRMLC